LTLEQMVELCLLQGITHGYLLRVLRFDHELRT
jgi:hypothetical protein